MTWTPHSGPRSSAITTTTTDDWDAWFTVVRSWGPDLGRGEWSVDYPKSSLIELINLEWERQDEGVPRFCEEPPRRS